MRDPNRIDAFLAEVGKLWKENVSDLRFCQLMENFFCWHGDCYYLEEEDFLKEFKKYLER